MAFTEFYCNASTGSNLNAGSTENGTAAFTYASGNWVAATGVFTVASGNPSSDGVAVGDFASVYANGSTVTGFVGRVTARDATTITVSLTAKGGTAPADGTGNRTLKIGGVWLGPNGTDDFPFTIFGGTLTNAAGDIPRCNFKNNATYSVSAAIDVNIAGPARFEGYASTAGDKGLCTFDQTANANAFATGTSGDNLTFANMIVTSSTDSGDSGFSLSNGSSGLQFYRIVCHKFDLSGWTNNNASGSVYIECETFDCNQSNSTVHGGFQHGQSDGVYIRCISHHHASGSNSAGFRVVGGTFLNCIADSNAGDGFLISGTGSNILINCDAYNNTLDGIEFSTASSVLLNIQNCNLVKNGGYGINLGSAGTKRGVIFNCGFGAGTQANSSGQVNAAPTGSSVIEEGVVTYASDVSPWVDPADGDFRINLAAAKGAGRGSFLQVQSGYGDPNPTVAYPDIGAAQHQDAGGGGGGGLSVRGITELGREGLRIA